MVTLDLLKDISLKTPSKIVLIVMDGLGGLPDPATGKTELETAKTPNIDKLLASASCGLIDPVSAGITPGSGPGHLALFGYDPVKYNIGRGVLEATGINFDIRPGDVAARGNLCTTDEKGTIIDRRAGRIETEKNAELCKLINGMTIRDITVLCAPVKDYRFVAVFRGPGLVPEVNDTDPEITGVPPLSPKALTPAAAKTANVVGEFVARAKAILAKERPANMILLRGFSVPPKMPTIQEIYKLNPVAIASYPMYRGLAQLCGMKVVNIGEAIEEEFATLKENYEKYDYFFMHIKGTDAAGEDGDFARKVRTIEQVDALMPAVTGLKPDVIVVTGDHSTPSVIKAHSWHPLPVLLYSKWCRPDGKGKFSEANCRTGELGRMPTENLMALMMANALKLNKFGA
jgi:2,3-bisphosphoglycerate-independent phosphoglycerate mutase